MEKLIQNIISCDDIQCFLVAEHFLEYFAYDKNITKFDQVLMDINSIYPDAILVGAIAASKYIQHPITPRVTFDVDLILSETDFKEFLSDEIPNDKLLRLDEYFITSDSASHSLKHQKTGIYVDFLSSESRPLRKKLIASILSDRQASTNILSINAREIPILKPELLVVLKLNRYVKYLRSEKGLSDRLDIVKILKSFFDKKELLSIPQIETFLTRREIEAFNEILDDVQYEMTTCPGDIV